MEIKVCRDCKIEKSFSEFGKDKYKKDGVKTLCKKCESRIRSYKSEEHRQRKKEWYENNKEKALASIEVYKQSAHGKRILRAATTKRKEKFSKKVFDYFGGECFICHRDEPFYEIYDGHHLDPAVKEFSLSVLFGRHWENVIVPELEKCVYLCAICHRKLHSGWFDEDIESGKLILVTGKRDG